MKPQCATKLPRPNELSLRVLVTRDDQTCRFELPADGHRAILVGSDRDADVRIDRFSPVAFYLERVENGVQLTPAYANSSLRVDARSVDKAVILGETATVELAGIRLLVEVESPEPLRQGLRAATVVSRALSSGSRGPSGFDEQQLETGTYARSTREPAVELCETREIDVDPLLDAKTTDWVPLPVGLLAAGTLPTAEAPPRGATQLSSDSEFDSAQTVEVSRQDVLEAASRRANSASDETTCIDVPLLPRYKLIGLAGRVEGEPPAGGPGPSVGPVGGALQPRKSDEGNRGPRGEALGRRSVRTLPPWRRWVAQLGWLAKRRPLAVLSTAAFGSLVLVLCFVGAAQLLGLGSRDHSAANLLRADDSSLRAATLPATKAIVPKVPSKPSTMPSAPDSGVLAVGLQEAKPLQQPEGSRPDYRSAAGHLFAGRLPEAAQAYQELAQHHPEEIALQAVARLLARRNRVECKTAGALNSTCPSVKP